MRPVRSRTALVVAVAAALAAAPISASAQVGDTTGDLFVGQLDATSNTPNVSGVDASGLQYPECVAFDADGNMFVADLGNHRVLGYRSPFTTDLVADIVIGQPDFNSNASNNGGVSASSLGAPTGMAVSANGDLYVADLGNNRVLEYDRPFATDTVADFVFGQPDFTTNLRNADNVSAVTLTGPEDVAVDRDGNVWIADTSGNRVLEYENPVATRDAVADIVLGQPNFTTSTQRIDDVSASTLILPFGVALDSDDNVWVTDTGNSRVLEYDDPRRLDAAADRVLGQPTFSSHARNYTGSVDASGLYDPERVRLDANGNVYVADTMNHRVLAYTAPIATRDRIADRVFGQPDFSSNLANNGGVSARCFNTPGGVAIDPSGNLAVAEFYNHRVTLIQAPTPIVTSIQAKVSAATRKAKLVVRGFGMQSGRAIVEVDGTALSTTHYKDVVGDGAADRVVALDDDFDALVPKGVAVTIVVVNPETGGRSAPISFTRR